MMNVHPDAEPCALCGASIAPDELGDYLCVGCQTKETDSLALLNLERRTTRRATHGGCPTCGFATSEVEHRYPLVLIETRRCAAGAWSEGYGWDRRWHYFTNNGKVCPVHKAREEATP